MPHSYFVKGDHRQALNGLHCGILRAPEMVTQHWADAATHPPLAPFSWYEAHAPESRERREVLRHKYGLPPFAFVYCAQPAVQARPADVPRWAALSSTREVPNSVLWLLRFPALAVPHITAAAAAEGLAPERIFWSDVTDCGVHRARLARRRLPRHADVQRPHDGDRRAVGGPPSSPRRGSRWRRASPPPRHAVACPEMASTTWRRTSA